MIFAYPWLLLLVGLLPIAWLLRLYWGKRPVALSFGWWPGIDSLVKGKSPVRQHWPQLVRPMAG